jgi:hypothetical protein
VTSSVAAQLTARMPNSVCTSSIGQHPGQNGKRGDGHSHAHEERKLVKAPRLTAADTESEPGTLPTRRHDDAACEMATAARARCFKLALHESPTVNM